MVQPQIICGDRKIRQPFPFGLADGGNQLLQMLQNNLAAPAQVVDSVGQPEAFLFG
ncbi:hypothetical protein D3C86_2187210 [compost metagenome]